MRDFSSPRPSPVRPLAAAGLSLALLGLGLMAPAFGGDRPASRIPLGEGQNATPTPTTEPPVLRPADLTRAAKQAPPALAALFRALAEANPETMPLYEETALKKIDEFLKGPTEGLTLLQQLRAADTALAAVLRFHLSAREHPPAGLNPRGEMETQLRRHLFDVRRRELLALAAAARGEPGWAHALAQADRLLSAYPRAESLLGQGARVRTAYAGFKLLHRDYAAARRQVEWVEAHFLHEPTLPPLRVTWLYHPSFASVRGALQEHAESLRTRAAASKDDAEAVALLLQARAAWPRLPGLQDDLLRRQHAYRILYVGVHSLPEFFSPATARTDPEKQAVQLLFEGLLRERYDDAQGERYVAQLADGPPATTEGGRLRFTLDRRAYWSNGERVTSRNVRDTVQLLKSPTLPGRTPEWTDLVEPPVEKAVVDADPFRLDVKLRQPYFDPLAALTFKVLPSLPRADDPEFARKPVGSGPYQYAGRRQDGDRTCAVFTANPYYVRAGRADRPYIREIRFYVPADPALDFRDPVRPLHLLLDLPTDRLTALRDAGVKDIRTLRNRRVYFLALNHRVPALADANLRRALARALDRERILTYRFRGGVPGYGLLAATGTVSAAATLDLRRDAHPEHHRPLNGPYPAGSWAVCPPPNVPANLYDFDRAKAFARKAAERDGAKRPPLELTLKYPSGDARVQQACQDIAAQLGELGESVGWPIRVRPVGVAPRELSEALEKRDYELAYHHLDYRSEAYWLWPLFDGRPEALAPGGANFLGYEDAALEGLFRAAMGRRDFAEVRKLTHEIHTHLDERMPLIPLWQLDTHVALHRALRPTHLDPLRVFDDVANWMLEK